MKIKSISRITSVILGCVMLWLLCPHALADGLLSADNANGRYFTDPSGKAVFLTGSHTWNNFQDGGWEALDFENTETFKYSDTDNINDNDYLSWMEENGQNFMRLWTPENTRDFTSPISYPVSPTIYQRVSEEDCDDAHEDCTANDGLRKFKFEFNDAYFSQLRERIIAAAAHHIYVSIMLFDSWGIGLYETGSEPANVWWKGHPYNADNNIDGLSGGAYNGFLCHTNDPSVSAVTALQKAYVVKVVETVNDLDNVLFEISNESFGPYPVQANDSTQWQWNMINLIKKTEGTPAYPKVHPVGMTSLSYNNSNQPLRDSNADWISPRHDPNGATYNELYDDDPPETAGDKVVILDTDHIGGSYGEGGDGYATRVWVWKSFTRGYSCIYMDQLNTNPDLNGAIKTSLTIPQHAPPVRDAMGDTRCYADRMNLIDMTPQPGLSTTGYVLAKVGEEYLVYQPVSEAGGDCGSRPAYFTVTLPANTYNIEWFDPKTGHFEHEITTIMFEDDYGFTAPSPNCETGAWTEDAVLYLTIYERDHLVSRPRS